ncbi:MAG TPA: ABC transporter ATP-binding protein [Candidatus Limnocylindrales bacterium]
MIPGRDTQAIDSVASLSPVVSVRDLRVRYPSAATDALDGVGFDLVPGELVGLVGLNGAGKSTLCRCLNGIVPQLVPADVSGSVTVGGMDALRTSVRLMACVVGVVLDEPDAQLSQGTVGEEVALGLESMAVPWSEMVARVDDVLARVGLAGMLERPPLSLSGGEQQRLVLACALALRPPVLVLDEPTSGLDPLSRAAVFDLLADVAARDGTAIIVAEHDVELLAERADRILVLHDGRLVASGTPAAVFGDVSAMRAAGVRVPDVTAVAVTLNGRAGEPLPVTFEGGLRWLAGIR